jgi:hypothetical protein
LTRATGDTNTGDSTDATKTFIDGVLTWYKDDNAGNALGGAVFTVCQTTSYDTVSGQFVDITDVCTDVTDDTDGSVTAGAGLDQDGAPGVFKLTGLALGQYTVTEKTAPAGYAKDSSTKNAALDPNNTSASITEHFVNNRSILKITGFGYTNAPAKTDGTNLCAADSPTSGVVHGCSTYTVDLHNYGGAAASVNVTLTFGGTANIQLVTASTSGPGTITGNTAGSTSVSFSGINVANGANAGTITVVIRYDATDGQTVTANLAAQYATNGLIRTASGSGATISFTAQSD